MSHDHSGYTAGLLLSYIYTSYRSSILYFCELYNCFT